jgi:LAS superfamily LD-carboxypeptidase LdcB
MINSFYIKKVINVVFIELGIFLIVLSVSNDDIKRNFDIYESQIIEKRVFGITDNSDIINNRLLMPVLSCSFPDSTISLYDLDEFNILLNKEVKLEQDYRPSDLVDISILGINSQGTVYLRNEAAIHLSYLNNDLKDEGINIRINSGWRNFDSQQDAYNYWKKALGNNASFYAAPVGSSEHHLGLAIDIVTQENNYKLMPSYIKTRLHKFMIENSYKYGFINSYPKDKESQTGFNYEPWHYRYVGIDVAEEIFERKITLTEYLYELNNYCLISY